MNWVLTNSKVGLDPCPEAIMSQAWPVYSWVEPLPTGQHAISKAMRANKAEQEEKKQTKRKVGW